MRRLCTLLVCIFCFAIGANANSTWLEDEANHPVQTAKTANKKFWVMAAGMALASLADGITTRRALSNGAIELNPLMGKRPSNLQLFGLGSFLTAGEVGGLYLLKRWDDHDNPTHAWVYVGTLQIGAETALAVHNERLSNRLWRFHHAR